MNDRLLAPRTDLPLVVLYKRLYKRELTLERIQAMPKAPKKHNFKNEYDQIKKGLISKQKQMIDETQEQIDEFLGMIHEEAIEEHDALIKAMKDLDDEEFIKGINADEN